MLEKGKGLLKLELMLQGYWGSLALDNEGCNWLVAGSSRGNVALWDMRYQVAICTSWISSYVVIAAFYHTSNKVACRVSVAKKLGFSCPDYAI